ncbi:MAG: VOC family protein [Phycisphaerales bacterium]|nr:VOC family protein [Phycisphaerales bacterium]
MICVGDIHIYVSDMAVAMRFWRDALALDTLDEESSPSAGYALLGFPDGGPCLRIFSGVDAWDDNSNPSVGARPGLGFDIVTDDFDGTLVKLIEAGGRKVDEIEEYEGARIVTLTDPDGNQFELVEDVESD